MAWIALGWTGWVQHKTTMGYWRTLLTLIMALTHGREARTDGMEVY